MSRERNTLVGTPTIIAPEAIRLTCDFGIQGERVAVYAAVSSYTTAQYFPRVHALSPLVSTAVDMAKAELGESADALPSGSVLLAPTDSHAGKRQFSANLDAAIAVATVATVYETAGQGIEPRKSSMLAVATDAHRFLHGPGDADIDLVLAMYGGLVVATLNPAMPPELHYPTTPPGLHLVLFQTGEAISTNTMAMAFNQFSRRDPKSFQTIVGDLVDQGIRFANEILSGNATAAIASFGRYGHRLMTLAAASSIPITGEGFAHAALLAKEIGGAVKHASFGGGDLGIALFATPEAAKLFSQACQAPLVALPFTLDRGGVRCRMEKEPSASDAVHTPAPEFATVSSDGIVRPSLDEDTTRETLSLPTLLMNESAENLALAPAPTPEPVPSPIAPYARRNTPLGIGPVELLPATPNLDVPVTVPYTRKYQPPPPPKRAPLSWVLHSLLIVMAMGVIGWLAFLMFRDGQNQDATITSPHPTANPPKQISRPAPIAPREVKAPSPEPAKITIVPPAKPAPEPKQAIEPAPKPAILERETEEPAPRGSHRTSSKTTRKGRASTSEQPTQDEEDSPPATPPTTGSTPPAPKPRAGKLSTDDF